MTLPGAIFWLGLKNFGFGNEAQTWGKVFDAGARFGAYGTKSFEAPQYTPWDIFGPVGENYPPFIVK